MQVLGTPVSLTVTFDNCGTSPVTLTFLAIEGPQASDFGETSTSNTTLQPNQSLPVTVTYSPAALGPSTAYLPYTACAGCVPQVIPLSGVGVDCQLTLSPSPVNFGAVPSGSTATQTLTVTDTDTGTETCTITSFGTYNANSVFTLSGYPSLPTSLAPQQSFTATVSYTATGAAAGDSDQLLSVFTVADPAVAPRTAEDLLSGNQTLPPCSLGISPSSVNFGPVVNSAASRQVTLTNSGSTACQVSAIALAAGSDPTFSLGSQPTSLTVQPGRSQDITVTFAPTGTTAPLIRRGQLTFQTGDPTQPTATVTLTGMIGCGCPYEPGWPKWHFDNFNSGQTNADTSGLQGTVAWKYAIGAPGSGNTYINSPVISTVPTAAPWVLYQMDMTGTLHALSNAGAQLWTQTLTSPARDPHPATPAVLADGSMFVALATAGGGATDLYLVSDTGTVTFSEPFGIGGFASCPALAQDGTLFLADAFSGSSACGGAGSFGDPSSALAFSSSATAVTQAGGLALPLTAQSKRFGVVVADDDTSYWASNGQFFAVSPPASGFGLVSGWPACGVTLASAAHPVSDLALDSLTTGYLLAYSAWEKSTGSNYTVQGNLAALNTATGATQWTFSLPVTNLPYGWTSLESDVGNAAPAIAYDGTVYVGNGDGLRAIDGATGALSWLFSTANVSSSPAIGGDGTVFFGCDDGNFYAVNPDGTLRFRIGTGGPISSSPAIAPDGTVVFVSDDGNLYAVQ